MDGGTRVAEVLKTHGVPYLFTLCGGHISPILVACKRLGIRVVDVRHEVNAVFAADAVARLTGVPGVAAVTAGPGVTNTITAIKNAQMAQSPLVLLGGATATILRGRGSLQDIDQMALIRPHVKWAARPNRLREIVPALQKAFAVAQDGVPGPVFVELAVDLLYDEETVREWTMKSASGDSWFHRALGLYLRAHLKNVFIASDNPKIEPPSAVGLPEAPDATVQQAATLLAEAERPVMVVGSQTMLWPSEVNSLVTAIQTLGIPTYLSGMARGLLGASHPLWMRHKRRNALREADLVILSGVPSDFRMDYGNHVSRSAKLLSVNRCRTDLRKNRRPDLGALADPHRFLVSLSRAMGSKPTPSRTGWLAKLQERNQARDDEIAALATEVIEPMNPLQVCHGIERQLTEDSVLVGDGGDFVATASYIVRPRKPLSWLDPGVFGTLGVGAGFALGAKLVRPESDVWILYGDGAAGFSLMEYDTFVRHQVPVIGVVGNDACWSQIARDQEVILDDDVGTVLSRTAYHTVADGLGAKGFLIDQPENIDTVLEQAVRTSREGQPVLVNAQIGRTEFRKGSLSM